MDDRAIGFFDSGIGGLSCVSAFKALLPHESVLYYGDVLHAPYGDRSREELAGFANRIADFLTAQNIKMLTVACNTISSFHLDALRARYPGLPVVGTIEMTAEYLAGACKGRRIGIIATRATVSNGTYVAQLKKYGCSQGVYPLACPEFVPMIESGVHDGPQAEAVVRRAMDGFIRETDPQVLVLGCTHFPFIAGVIQRLYPQLELVDPALIIAAGAKAILEEKQALASPGGAVTERYYASLITPACLSAVETVSGRRDVELKVF